MLDTNICIYLLKRQPAEVLRRLEALRQGEAVISVVTHAELRAGLEMQTINLKTAVSRFHSHDLRGIDDIEVGRCRRGSA